MAKFRKLHKRNTVLTVAAMIMLIMAAFEYVPAQRDQNRTPVYRHQLQRSLKKFELIKQPSSLASKSVLQTGMVQLDSGLGTFTLQLEPYDIRSENYRAETVSSQSRIAVMGKRRIIRTYKGIVLELPEATARVTVDENTFEGMILTPSDTYCFERAQNFARTASPEQLILYKSSDVTTNFGNCGVGLGTRVAAVSAKASDGNGVIIRREIIGGAATQNLPKLSPPYEVEIATDADYEYVKFFGSVQRANDEILGILNMVEGIYGNQIGLRISVVFQNAYETPADPYTGTDADTLLSQFHNYWNANHADVARDEAHLWTGKKLGQVIGLAATNTVCNVPTSAYGLSQRLDAVVGKGVLTAHEIGHTFGATHPDQENPKPPDCLGTIMESEINGGFSFCTFSIDQISNHILGNPSCLTQLPDSGDGRPDPSFGSGGKVITDFGTDRDRAFSVVAQPDGKIVVAGDARGPLAIARYGVDGVLDPSFGTGGQVTNKCGGTKAIVLQPDGKLISAGGCIVRYDSNGMIDSSFQGGAGFNPGVINAAVLQSDGKIIVGGSIYLNIQPKNFGDFALSRYNPGGSIDRSFGNAGTVKTDFDGDRNVINALAIQPDGKIIAVGMSGSAALSSKSEIARYNPNGSLDATFGSGGRVVRFPQPITGNSAANAIAVDADGKIVVAGWNYREADYRYMYYSLERYTSNGNPDLTFGLNGRVLTPFGGRLMYDIYAGGGALGMVLQPDGKIVVSGSAALRHEYDRIAFALLRFNSNGSLDPSFGSGGQVLTSFDPPGGRPLAYGYGVTIGPEGKIIQVGNAWGDFAVVRYLNATVTGNNK